MNNFCFSRQLRIMNYKFAHKNKLIPIYFLFFISIGIFIIKDIYVLLDTVRLSKLFLTEKEIFIEMSLITYEYNVNFFLIMQCKIFIKSENCISVTPTDSTYINNYYGT